MKWVKSLTLILGLMNVGFAYADGNTPNPPSPAAWDFYEPVAGMTDTIVPRVDSEGMTPVYVVVESNTTSYVCLDVVSHVPAARGMGIAKECYSITRAPNFVVGPTKAYKKAIGGTYLYSFSLLDDANRQMCQISVAGLKSSRTGDDDGVQIAMKCTQVR